MTTLTFMNPCEVRAGKDLKPDLEQLTEIVRESARADRSKEHFSGADLTLVAGQEVLKQIEPRQRLTAEQRSIYRIGIIAIWIFLLAVVTLMVFVAYELWHG